MSTIDLQTADRAATEGIRATLDLDVGHIAMDGDALMIAQTRQALDHWLTRENHRAEPEIVEPVTVLVQDTTVIEASETTEEEPASNEAAETDASDDGSEGSGGESLDEMDGPDLSEGPATRSQVLTRIKTRARTASTTSGRRSSRRRNTAGRSIV